MMTYVRGFGSRFRLSLGDEMRRQPHQRVLHYQRYRETPLIYGDPITTVFDSICHFSAKRYAFVPLRKAGSW